MTIQATTTVFDEVLQGDRAVARAAAAIFERRLPPSSGGGPVLFNFEAVSGRVETTSAEYAEAILEGAGKPSLVPHVRRRLYPVQWTLLFEVEGEVRLIKHPFEGKWAWLLGGARGGQA